MVKVPRFKIGQQVRVASIQEQEARLGDAMLKREIGKVVTITYVETFLSGNSLLGINTHYGERFNGLRFNPICDSEEFE